MSYINRNYALFFGLIILIFCSCNSPKNNNPIGGVDSTPPVNSNDTVAKNWQSDYNKKHAGDEVHADPIFDLVQVKEEAIIYDSDFKQLITAKITNNMKEDIIAFELIIDPNINYEYNKNNQRCDVTTIKEKILVPAGKSIVVKDKFEFTPQDGCNIDHAKIYLGNFILSNGKKTSLQMLYFEQGMKTN